jgi:uncharacterized phage protein (TIGR02220 family)
MAKVPYIPLYIGDWEQDTNCISPLAEFALLKLTFKLFKSEKKGVIVTNFNTLSILFKSDLAKTKEIFNELYENNILNFEFIEDDKIRIISRRMVRESNLSEIRSNCGKEGGRGNKANEKQKESKKKAKVKQIPEYDNDNNILLVVKYLNEKTSKNFSEKSVISKKNISARLKDGFQISDFKSVIDTKVQQWTDDPKMCIYLNPETLFGNKFEKYLNEVPKKNLLTEQVKPMTDEEYAAYIKG